MLIYKLTSIVRTSSNFTKDVPLSYEAAVLFLNHYRTLECRGVLFIEQDDSAGLATIRQLVERSPKGQDLVEVCYRRRGELHDRPGNAGAGNLRAGPRSHRARLLHCHAIGHRIARRQPRRRDQAAYGQAVSG